MDSSDSRFTQKSGFTLLELLVVIAIIAILAGLTVPVISRAVESGRRTTAMTEVASLEAAVRAYYNEYSRFPHQGANKAQYIGGNADLINVLRAIDGEGNANHVNNRRRIVFLEVPDRSLSRNNAGDIETNPDMVDPWGVPYNVAVDVQFRNEVDTSQPHGILENRMIAVWSGGADPSDVSRHLTSW